MKKHPCGPLDGVHLSLRRQKPANDTTPPAIRPRVLPRGPRWAFPLPSDVAFTVDDLVW